MSTHVMVDIETLSILSNAAVISIGAVEFNPESGMLGREYYARINPESCIEQGLVMDVGTVMWWMNQSDAARTEFSKGGDELIGVLCAFSKWLPKESLIWGNGANFDNVILANTFKACHMQAPWQFHHDRCYRTLKDLRRDIKPERIGTAHNALNDAKTQALHAIKLLQALSKGGAA